MNEGVDMNQSRYSRRTEHVHFLLSPPPVVLDVGQGPDWEGPCTEDVPQVPGAQPWIGHISTSAQCSAC